MTVDEDDDEESVGDTELPDEDDVPDAMLELELEDDPLDETVDEDEDADTTVGLELGDADIEIEIELDEVVVKDLATSDEVVLEVVLLVIVTEVTVLE